MAGGKIRAPRTCMGAVLILLRDLAGFPEPEAPGFGAEPQCPGRQCCALDEARARRGGIGPKEAARPPKAGRAA